VASAYAMASSEHARRWRRWVFFCLAAALGAALVVMPALASSEGGSIEAKTVVSGYSYAWSPMQASIGAGAAVTFKNSTSVEHGVEWISPPSTPSCTGVPGASAGLLRAGASWSGSCTFAKAGEYSFYCTVHGAAMSGKVIVAPNGETTVTPTGTSTPTYPPPTAGEGGSTPYPAGAPNAGGGALVLLAGSASNAVKVAASQHGHAVRGSVAIAPAGQGARLEVDLLARSAVLARAGEAALARIGRLVVSHVHAGAVRFSVSLSQKARKALARHRRLAVTVHITLQSASAKPITITRSTVLRP
jgi:plastocyanin